MSLPYSNFFWADWENEPTLKKCSAASQGVWMRVLAVMHRATPRGHFLDETGARPSLPDLVKHFGMEPDVIEAAIAELTARRVCDVSEAGVLICRKMVRQEEKSQQARANGALGGNPALLAPYDAGMAELRAAAKKEAAAERQRRRRERLSRERDASQDKRDASRSVTVDKRDMSRSCHAEKRDSHAVDKRDAEDRERENTGIVSACHADNLRDKPLNQYHSHYLEHPSCTEPVPGEGAMMGSVTALPAPSGLDALREVAARWGGERSARTPQPALPLPPVLVASNPDAEPIPQPELRRQA